MGRSGAGLSAWAARRACASCASTTSRPATSAAIGRVSPSQAESAGGARETVVVDHARQGECGRRPEIVVVVAAGAHRRRRADQRGEGVDRRQVPRRGDPDEALSVEVVAAEQALAVVARCEQTRLTVVQQVALVDRLHAGSARLPAERAPDLASTAGLGGQ